MNKEIKQKNFRTLVDLFICIVIVLVLFIPTISRPWISYDERGITNELYLPIPTSFQEIYEIIESFGLNYSVTSSNTLYSSNYITRTCPLSTILTLSVLYLFKSNSIYYHLMNLCLHLITTCLIFIILKNLLKACPRPLIILLTILWGIHPVELESVLLSTNFGALISYMFFFIFLLDFLKNKEKNKSILRQCLIPLLFMIPMLTNEYIITLPLVLFTFSFYENYKNNDFRKAISLTIIHTKPYFIGLFIYILYFFFISHYSISQTSNHNYFLLLIERGFWLSPQVFFHLIKLVFFPFKLSIDQGVFVTLGKSLFDPYSIFCILFMSIWLFVPLIFFLSKRKLENLFLLTWSFFFALLPFLHILMPSYTLAAERYLYAPLAIMIIGVGIMLNENIHKYGSRPQSGRGSLENRVARPAPTSKGILQYALTLIIVLCFMRSYIRTQDWKNDFTLANSTIQITDNLLLKGIRTQDLGQTFLKSNPNNLTKAYKHFTKAQEYFYQAIEKLKQEKKENPKIPLILKSYGLDYDSLSVKAIYLICVEPFNNNSENKKDYEDALRILIPYLKHIKIFDPRTLELYANLLIKNNDLESAKKIFLYAYNKYPTQQTLLISLIRLNRDIERNLPEAKNYLLKALRLYPYSKDILFEAVRYYQTENNLEEYSRYAYLYGLRAHSAFTYREALTGFLTLGTLDKAKQAVEKLLRLDPSNPRTLYLVSSYYIKIQNYDLAITLLNQALTLNQNKDKQLEFDLNNLLANLYLAQGSIEQGIHHIIEALNIDKENIVNKNKMNELIKRYRLNLHVP